MSEPTSTLRTRNVELPQFHNEAAKLRHVAVAFGMPYETLLGVICHSSQNAKFAGQFFGRLYTEHPDDVRIYLKGFITRIMAELDFEDSGLRVKPDFKSTPMDFVRPSPVRGFMLPAFFAELTMEQELGPLLKTLPTRIVKALGLGK